MFIVAISFLIHNYGFVYKERKAIIFQLHPRYENTSIEDIKIQEVEHKYHPRTLFSANKPLIWMVESFYHFFYIKLNIAGKIFHMIVDSGSMLSWVNCNLIDHQLGPSPNYLVSVYKFKRNLLPKFIDCNVNRIYYRCSIKGLS